MKEINKNIIKRFIRMLDIGYITFIFFTLAYIVSVGMDIFIFGPFNKEKNDKKSIFRIYFELFFTMWLYGIIIYVTRVIVSYIPSPLDGIFGFNHNELLDFHVVFSVIFIWNQHNFLDKLSYLYNRVQNNSKVQKIYNLYDNKNHL